MTDNRITDQVQLYSTLNNNDESIMKEIEDKDVIFLRDVIYA